MSSFTILFQKCYFLYHSECVCLVRGYTWTYHLSTVAEGLIRSGSTALSQFSKMQVTPVISRVNMKGTGRSSEYLQSFNHDNSTHYFLEFLLLLNGLLIAKIPYIPKYLRSARHDRMNVFLS